MSSHTPTSTIPTDTLTYPPSSTFQSLSMSLSGKFPPLTQQQMRTLLRKHGAQVSATPRKKTQYIICGEKSAATNNAPLDDIITNTFPEWCILVNKDWVFDCIKQGRLIDVASGGDLAAQERYVIQMPKMNMPQSQGPKTTTRGASRKRRRQEEIMDRIAGLVDVDASEIDSLFVFPVDELRERMGDVMEVTEDGDVVAGEVEKMPEELKAEKTGDEAPVASETTTTVPATDSTTTSAETAAPTPSEAAPTDQKSTAGPTETDGDAASSAPVTEPTDTTTPAESTTATADATSTEPASTTTPADATTTPAAPATTTTESSPQKPIASPLTHKQMIDYQKRITLVVPNDQTRRFVDPYADLGEGEVLFFEGRVWSEMYCRMCTREHTHNVHEALEKGVFQQPVYPLIEIYDEYFLLQLLVAHDNGEPKYFVIHTRWGVVGQGHTGQWQKAYMTLAEATQHYKELHYKLTENQLRATYDDFIPKQECFIPLSYEIPKELMEKRREEELKRLRELQHQEVLDEEALQKERDTTGVKKADATPEKKESGAEDQMEVDQEGSNSVEEEAAGKVDVAETTDENSKTEIKQEDKMEDVEEAKEGGAEESAATSDVPMEEATGAPSAPVEAKESAAEESTATTASEAPAVAPEAPAEETQEQKPADVAPTTETTPAATAAQETPESATTTPQNAPEAEK